MTPAACGTPGTMLIKTSTPFQNEQAADHVNVTLEKCYAKCTKSLITALSFNPTTMRKSDGICLIYVAGTGVVPFRIPPGKCTLY